jgi:hypothetical protein
MKIWHDTVDAPRTPRRVSPGQGIDIIVGTWPIGPGQSVWVTWLRLAANGRATEGNAVAERQRNSDVRLCCLSGSQEITFDRTRRPPSIPKLRRPRQAAAPHAS